MIREEKVQILMSTYNGKKYLKEQMDSLLSQTYENIEIIVRDDGSSDGTGEILEIYQKQHSNVRVYLQENIGLVDSFFWLLEQSDAEYVAFCDQDDVWKPKKIERAVEQLKKIKGPAVYCGNKMLVNAELKEMGLSDQQTPKPGFGNAVIENIVTGCTMVLNRELTDLLKKQIPKHAVLHDWWCYLAATYYGAVIYDAVPYIYYRQHGENQVGGKAGVTEQIAAKRKYLKKNKGKLKKQLQEFHEIHHGDREKDEILINVLETENFSGRIRMLFDSEVYRQKKLDNLIVKVLFLTNHMLS